MNVEFLVLPKEMAQKELEALKNAVKQNIKLRKEQIYVDFQRVYGFITRHGGKVIDIYEAFKHAGVNEDGDPKLAICRADGKICYCVKHVDGSAIFSINDIGRYDKPRKTFNDVVLPAGTFQWQKLDPSRDLSVWNIKREKIKALVPIIPPRLLECIRHSLSNYHVLWEVEKWEHVPPKDPILVKQLTPNLFGVLATWDLTPLERAIIRGRIQ